MKLGKNNDKGFCPQLKMNGYYRKEFYLPLPASWDYDVYLDFLRRVRYPNGLRFFTPDGKPVFAPGEIVDTDLAKEKRSGYMRTPDEMRAAIREEVLAAIHAGTGLALPPKPEPVQQVVVPPENKSLFQKVKGWFSF